MKRILIYIALLAGAVALRPESADIGKLRPVQLVSVYREDEWVILETDTEDLGRGLSIHDAIKNLKETTPGVIYLDTADFLLVHRDTQNMIPELTAYLKGKVRVCIAEGDIPLTDASDYLAAHPPKTRIRDWYPEKQLEILQHQGERIILRISENSENNA